VAGGVNGPTAPASPVRPLWLLKAGAVAVAVVTALSLLGGGGEAASRHGLSPAPAAAIAVGVVLLVLAGLFVARHRRDRTRRWDRRQTALAVLIVPGIVLPGLAGLLTGIRFPDPGAIVGGVTGLALGWLAYSVARGHRMVAVRHGPPSRLFTGTDALAVVIAMLVASAATGLREVPRRYGTVAACVDLGPSRDELRFVTETACSGPHDGEVIRTRPGRCPTGMISTFKLFGGSGRCIRPTRR